MGNDITEALRNEVARRAHHRCQCCRIHEDDIAFRPLLDHIVSRKHGGLSDIDNLAYACVLCNRSNGSHVAAIDARSGASVRLFHPREDLWADHFQLDDHVIDCCDSTRRKTRGAKPPEISRQLPG